MASPASESLSVHLYDRRNRDSLPQGLLPEVLLGQGQLSQAPSQTSSLGVQHRDNAGFGPPQGLQGLGGVVALHIIEPALNQHLHGILGPAELGQRD
ncbi:hypothetical protein [Vulcanococcus limneticus]|uniref:hypothetical protein n=1 Tax=Vulcanococcus limneticus TaxID=2170428 RepID=UPI00398BE27F